MSEQTTDMQIVDVEQTTDKEESRDQIRQEDLDNLKKQAEELSDKISEARSDLSTRKYSLVYKSKTSPGNFDESIYADRKGYINDLKKFLEFDVEFTNMDFIPIIGLNELLDDIIENFDEVGDEFDYTQLETMYSLIYQTKGKGLEEAKRREFILRPINNTYHLYQDSVMEIKEMSDEYTQIMNMIDHLSQNQ